MNISPRIKNAQLELLKSVYITSYYNEELYRKNKSILPEITSELKTRGELPIVCNSTSKALH